MNIDTDNLTYENRLDLIISDRAVEKELFQLLFPKINCDFIDTR
jgi:hypothetical protein